MISLDLEENIGVYVFLFFGHTRFEWTAYHSAEQNAESLFCSRGVCKDLHRKHDVK